MGLAAELRALGAVVEPPEQQWGDPDLPAAQLCPRLKTTYSPRASWVEWRGFGADPRASMPEWARVWDYGPSPEALGLSLAQRSKRGTREGLKGLPAAGRKQVWRSLALLEDDRRLLSFWTVSLPTASLLALARADSLPVFQDRLRKELARRLQRAGLPARLVGVVELQPQRSRAAGIPCPHWHVVFQGRKSPGHHWALSPADLDEVIRAALASAGAPVPPDCDAAEFLKAAGNVQQVKRSVRAYLSKYMTKGSGDTSRWVGTEAEALLPRRWWFWSRPLRSFVMAHVFPIAFGFLCWCHKHRRDIEEAGLARWRLLPLSDERAPLTYEISWLRTSFVAELVAVWQEDEWDEEWWGQHRLRQSHRGIQ
jgi:hypothetical protein